MTSLYSQFYLHNLRRWLNSILVIRTALCSGISLQAVNWETFRACFNCQSCLSGHCTMLSYIQCLQTIVFMYIVWFFFFVFFFFQAGQFFWSLRLYVTQKQNSLNTFLKPYFPTNVKCYLYHILIHTLLNFWTLSSMNGSTSVTYILWIKLHNICLYLLGLVFCHLQSCDHFFLFYNFLILIALFFHINFSLYRHY